ncbi:aminotransferase class I/II-fold pyridoxal phosphate-dependent enzyme [Streptomyces sp. NPDC091268]|uniref:aminotransferase class I/II-fold pyridoxal phosphate-dependent enzyme n=1 Tax=Streptomyces sp. NPDC091268 TaxID=3365979 RepID=UPI0037FB87A5
MSLHHTTHHEESLAVEHWARAADSYPYYRVLSEHPTPAEVVVDGRQAVNAASTDYLGLARDGRVTEAAARAAARHGTSCSGSPLISGTRTIHREFEEELAAFLNRPAVTLTATGYQANLALACLFGEQQVVVSDRHNHASLVDAVRLGRAMGRTYRHNDAAHLDKVLRDATRDGRTPVILTESVFSVQGDLLDVPAVTASARRHDATLIIDRAHDIGVLGEGGPGGSNHAFPDESADIVTGTFSKALGSVGGFVAGSVEVSHVIRHYGRAAVFSASIPPAAVAAARAALRILQEEPEHRTALTDVSAQLHDGLARLGHPRTAWPGPIVALPVDGGAKTCMSAWRALLDRGVFAAAFVPPAAPRPLMRFSVTAAHTPAQVDGMLQAISDVLDVSPSLPGPRPRAATTGTSS